MRQSHFAIMGLFVLLSTMAWGAEAVSLMDALSGKAFPLSITIKELTPEWRRFTLGEQGGGQAMAMMAMMEGIGLNNSTYYTRAQAVEIAGETFLVAYSRPRKAFDPRIFDGHEPPMPEPLTPQTALTLSLLNLRTVGNLLDIRPFDAQAEVMQDKEARDLVDREQRKARHRALQATSMNNLRQICVATLMCVQDNDETFPQMQTPAEMQAALQLVEKVLISPITNEPYQPNPSLSKVPLTQIKHPEQVVIAYEATADEEGNRIVGFCDGHVEVVNEKEWAKVKERSGIP